jgi:hypothetical protein
MRHKADATYNSKFRATKKIHQKLRILNSHHSANKLLAHKEPYFVFFITKVQGAKKKEHLTSYYSRWHHQIHVKLPNANKNLSFTNLLL